MSFKVVDEQPYQPEQVQPQQEPNRAALMGLQMIAQGLATISKRFVLAVYNTLFVAMFGVTAFLWYTALETMTWEKIVGLSLFSLFTLGLVKLVRRV